ncbi:MAG: methyltransferase [Myxococcaceae bacterium]|nr:methyltransferase [Myxococcaceae bacterium]
MPKRLDLFATAAKSTEDLLVSELNDLGIAKVKQGRGGVRFSANLHEALRVCLHSRIAMRVLYPLGEFEAKGADGLYDAVKQVPWEEHFTPSSTFAVDATLRESEHTHSGFVALKIKDALVDRLREKLGSRPDVDTRNPQLRVVAHLAKTTLSLSLDLCGEPLNRRGYRVESTTAPLKETLAAAVLQAAQYEPKLPLVDPMCGSGTLLIEAAFIAMRRPPGLKRSFDVERWPKMGVEAKAILADLKAEAEGQLRGPPEAIVGRDRDEEAVAAAQHNVRRAGLERYVKIEVADVMVAPMLKGKAGLIVSNPPYGDRLTAGGQKGMKTFYYQLGEALAEWKGWRASMLCGNSAFESAFHKRPTMRRSMWNGPIECQQLSYQL